MENFEDRLSAARMGFDYSIEGAQEVLALLEKETDLRKQDELVKDLQYQTANIAKFARQVRRLMTGPEIRPR